MMTKPKISIIVAITKKDRGIGHDSELLFRISDDLKRFKAITTGHPIIMGRKTFESIGKPLPHRENIVVTRNAAWSQPGVTVAHSLTDALSAAQSANQAETNEIFIIGGGELYREAMESNLVDRLYLTIINAEPAQSANVFFPEYESQFSTKSSDEERVDPATGISYSWITLER